MTRWILVPALGFLLGLGPAAAQARGHGGHGGGGHHSGSYTSSRSSSYSHSYGSHSGGHSWAGAHHSASTHSYSSKSHSSGSRWTSHGKYKRDPEQRRAFMRQHPCPSTGKTSGACPGYVVDHVQALKHGGADSPSNMQWQSKEAAKAKDKWE